MYKNNNKGKENKGKIIEALLKMKNNVLAFIAQFLRENADFS